MSFRKFGIGSSETFQIIDQCRIKERFQLQENDVRLTALACRRKIVFRLLNSLDFLFGIIPRTADSCIKDRNCQTIWISVILIGKCNITKVIGKYSLIQSKLCNFLQMPPQRQLPFKMIIAKFHSAFYTSDP